MATKTEDLEPGIGAHRRRAASWRRVDKQRTERRPRHIRVEGDDARVEAAGPELGQDDRPGLAGEPRVAALLTAYPGQRAGSLNSVSDLGFRYLYVGAADVQWDNAFGLGLMYMHARHYNAGLGRFLQPDPSRAESNLYSYANNDPITTTDAAGTCAFLCVVVIAFFVSAIVSAAAEILSENAQHQRIDPAQVTIAFFTGGVSGAACVYFRSLAACGRASAAAAVVQYHLSNGPKNPEGYVVAAWLGWVIRRWVHAPWVPRPPIYQGTLGWWILYGYPGTRALATAFRSLMSTTGINYGQSLLNSYFGPGGFR